MHLLIALKAFFLVLFNGARARQVDEVLRARIADESTSPATAPGTAARHAGKPEDVAREKPAPVPHKPSAAAKPARSEAITLLSALQREGRFVDFVMEDLTGFSDAQIGAVARDLHRDCAKLIERMFAIQPLTADAEGASIEIPTGFDAGRYRLVGNVSGTPPFRGALLHHGWQATTCELPAWVGSETASRVIAPAEIEVK